MKEESAKDKLLLCLGWSYIYSDARNVRLCRHLDKVLSDLQRVGIPLIVPKGRTLRRWSIGTLP